MAAFNGNCTRSGDFHGSGTRVEAPASRKWLVVYLKYGILFMTDMNGHGTSPPQFLLYCRWRIYLLLAPS
eukprot:8238744-Karenia_brevis.AAC.1